MFVSKSVEFIRKNKIRTNYNIVYIFLTIKLLIENIKTKMTKLHLLSLDMFFNLIVRVRSA